MLGWAGLGWACWAGWAGLGWAGWAGLGWAGLGTGLRNLCHLSGGRQQRCRARSRSRIMRADDNTAATTGDPQHSHSDNVSMVTV